MAPFPPLMAEAEHLASTVLLGAHGRRKAGQGDAFWQYRPALPWDEARHIDWRRSAKADGAFVKEREWQVAQSVLLWVDQGASMRFASTDDIPTKLHRARLLAMAVSIMLLRSGERVGLAGDTLPPRNGREQLNRLATRLTTDAPEDYAYPGTAGLLPQSRALFISDFMGDLAPLELALTSAAERGIRGAILQVLDPQEEEFPFHGRTVFQSIGGTIAHETLHAGQLRDRYLTRLAQRKDALTKLARATDFQITTHHTNDPASAALLWLFNTLEHR
ncbi:DUF58 domain-containing protein [Aestuariibius sp. HNIBRBA575]|uniref:DUF58 domain-containing protein n=1 Tax=Aestuariibius sp. HNIBRBA575 TaxID=3233343 RepID=UPI0034A41C2E